jgi:type I restriction enzyme S subunit
LRYVSESIRNQIKRYVISSDDLYISIAGTLGLVGEVPEVLDGALLTENAAKIVFNSNSNKTYFKYYLNSNEAQEHFNQAKGTGGGVPKLALFRIEDTLILYPPLPEQQKIAAILTSVDEVIEKTQAQIDKLKDLKTAMMQELLTNGVGTKPASADAALNNSTTCRESYIPHTEFKDSPVGRIPKSWEVVTTGSIAKSIVPGRNKPKLMVGNIPWLTIADLGDVYVYKSKSNRGVTRDILSEAKGKTLPKNTVIMSVVGEFGVSSVASGEVVINQQLHGFVCRKNIDPEFLCFSLRYHKAQMEKLATQTTIAYMNKDNAESVQIALPTLQEQQKIASTLMSIDNNIVAVNKSLIIKKALKKALMQDLLTGKVRVKVD